MDMRLTIGRNPDGGNTFQVPPEYSRVSRQHATLHWQNGRVTIEDNGSTNGTFVNGKRITTQTQIWEGDTIWLGGNGMDNKCYKLDLKKIFASFPNVTPQLPYKTDPNDFSEEFVLLKKAYIEYHAKLSKLTRKTSLRMQLPRVMLSSLPAIVGLILMIKYGFGGPGIIAMSAGTVLTGLIGTLTMGKNSKRQDKLSEDILDLQLKYQKEYKCPKCGKKYDLDLHWKRLLDEGKCPHGCGAKFV